MFCKYCGTRGDENAKFCVQCGATATPNPAPAQEDTQQQTSHYQWQQPPPAYQQQWQTPPQNRTNNTAVVGLVFAFIMPLIGLIVSIIARGQIAKSNESGRGIATAGIIVSVLVMLFWVLIGVLGTIAYMTSFYYYW